MRGILKNAMVAIERQLRQPCLACVRPITVAKLREQLRSSCIRMRGGAWLTEAIL